LYALLGVILIDSFSYSMILPILPFVVFRDGGGVRSGGLLISIHAIFAMLSAPLLGRLSDRVGRKNVILITLAIELLSYSFFAFSRNLVELFVARALAGISAGNLGVVQAAIADETTYQHRGRAMGKLTASWALGFVLGPALSTVLPKHAPDPTWLPGIIAAVAGCVSLISISTLYSRGAHKPLPDSSFSLQKHRDDASSIISRNEILAQVGFMAFCQTGLVAMTGFFVTMTLTWDQMQLSLLMVWSAITIISAQTLVVPLLLKRRGEAGTILISLPVVAACAGLLSLHTPSSLLACAAIPFLFCFITVTQTSLTTLLSNTTGSHEQGATLGLASGAAAAGRILGPAILGILFDRLDPRAPYGIAFAIATCLCAWVAMRNRGKLLCRVSNSNPAETD
jgi:DHA1 family tetracycline resistance protein-like MFS transporter